MSPAKALRLSIARAAEDLWDLPAAASGISVSEETLDAAVESIPDGGLILLLEGPEGLVGAAHLPFPLVAGLVEAQTIGQVAANAPDTRRVTRTDAAMVAPLIDDMLERFEDLLDEGGIAPWARGFRFGTMMDSARMLSLALKATDFHVIRYSLDLAARREGEAMIMMPVVEEVAIGPVGGGTDVSGALEPQILQAPTELRAVLHRVSMPLSAVSKLEVGEVLTIPRDALARTEVEVGPQTVIGTTKLGQVNGMRALRLHLPGAPEARIAQIAGDVAPPDAPGADPVAVSAAARPAPEPEPDPAPLPQIDIGAVGAEPDFAPAPVEQQDDLLGDLPDLGDLPGMDDDEDDLPDLGAMPMATLPIID
ncbi:FliM/FliN family flagellar motor switch protein [Pseudooceanicola onchidii]|uniref:FliM/FliN family flagellar motor switch protein n=1 Tax=Pseudooceanicola onchidii TaxID=2562279 RepID=UPI00145A31B2|nr:FliM/FliN family flagellar motor C-terminal domain-containing protein [Pseudooceanicola onchidii]